MLITSWKYYVGVIQGRWIICHVHVKMCSAQDSRETSVSLALSEHQVTLSRLSKAPLMGYEVEVRRREDGRELIQGEQCTFTCASVID